MNNRLSDHDMKEYLTKGLIGGQVVGEETEKYVDTILELYQEVDGITLFNYSLRENRNIGFPVDSIEGLHTDGVVNEVDDVNRNSKIYIVEHCYWVCGVIRAGKTVWLNCKINELSLDEVKGIMNAIREAFVDIDKA